MATLTHIILYHPMFSLKNYNFICIILKVVFIRQFDTKGNRGTPTGISEEEIITEPPDIKVTSKPTSPPSEYIPIIKPTVQSNPPTVTPTITPIPPTPVPLPTMLPSRSPTHGVSTCVCDGIDCIDPYLIYSELSICISLLDEPPDGVTLSIDQVNSLNITHPETGTIFEVIYLTSTNDDEGVRLVISPWANIEMNDDQTNMVVRIEPGGLDVWFRLFSGSIIEVSGRVQIKEETIEIQQGGKEEEEGDGLFVRNLIEDDTERQIYIYEETFGVTAGIVAAPTQFPSEHPSRILPEVVPCICNDANQCLNFLEFTASESNPIVRLCLNFQDDDDKSAVIDQVTYLKFQSVENGFIFEAITEDQAQSPLITSIETNVAGADMVLTIELLPPFFFEATTININGLAQVTDGMTTGLVPWHELSFAAAGQETLSPSSRPSVYSPFNLQACHCDLGNNCLVQEPLVMNSDGTISPLRVCILVKDELTGEVIPEMLDVQSLIIVQDFTGAVLTLKDEGDDDSTDVTAYVISFEDGATVITIMKTSSFFQLPPPLPGIKVEGTAQLLADVGVHSSWATFRTPIIPLEVITEQPTSVPTAMPSAATTDSPTASSGPSFLHFPSNTPSVRPSGAPSANPTFTSLPTEEPDAGVLACVCDHTLTCIEKTFSEVDVDLKVCLLARPKGVGIAKISFLAIVQTNNVGNTVHSVLITPSSQDDDPNTSVMYYQNVKPPRQATISTIIQSKFFQGFNVGVHEAKMQGIVQINTGTSNSPYLIDINFDVKLHLVPLASAMPSVVPSESTHPTLLPTLGPVIGLPANIDVWGTYSCVFLFNHIFLLNKPNVCRILGCQCNRETRKCEPDILTQYNNEAVVCIFSTRVLYAVERYDIRGKKLQPRLEIIDEGIPLVPSEQIEIIDVDGTHEQAVVVSKIPANFFKDMFTIVDGKALMMVTIPTTSGTGKSDVSTI